MIGLILGAITGILLVAAGAYRPRTTRTARGFADSDAAGYIDRTGLET